VDDMATRIVEVRKAKADTKLGVRLSGSKGKPVKVVELNEEGPLAGKLFKGDIIESINGVRCSEGHSKAAEMLRNASGLLKLEVGKRKSSIFSKKPSAQVLSKAQSSFTNVDETPTPSPPKPTPMPVRKEEPVVAAAVVPEPVAKEPASLLEAKVPEAVVPVVPAVPVPTHEPLAAKPKPAAAALAPDEYMVTLQRHGTASIGMRLVQKKHTELPFIADIDPQGPAAKTEITVGDVLLEVNGIDARASHEELKKALGTTDAALLKLRRSTPKAVLDPEPKAISETLGSGKYDEKPKPQSGFFLFSCCASRGPPANE